MSDWIHALPLGWMALLVFGGTALVTSAIYRIVIRLATEDRARAFKGVFCREIGVDEKDFWLLAHER